MSRNAAPTSRRQLRGLAGQALTHYALELPRIAVLSTKEHAVLRVEAYVPGRPSPERFALRLYDPRVFHESSVATELEWLAALRHDSELVVPEPVSTRSGELLLRCELEGETAPRACALFRWVPGRRRTASLTPGALARVGCFVGKLHQHATRFVPPSGGTAQRWDWDRVFGSGSPVGPGHGGTLFSAEQQALFQALAASIHTAMQGLGTGPEVWGLIHADLNSSNYLFHGADVGAIDFEDCGWGYYLFDLAVILDELYAVHPSRAADLRSGLLSGYRQIRVLTDVHEAQLDLFMAMRLAELVRWHATSDIPAHRAAVPQLLVEAVDHMRRLELPTVFR